MKKFLRITALSVALLMICLPLFACKDNKDTSDSQSAASGGTAENDKNNFYGYVLPEGVDYKGRTVGVLTTGILEDEST